MRHVRVLRPHQSLLRVIVVHGVHVWFRDVRKEKAKEYAVTEILSMRCFPPFVVINLPQEETEVNEKKTEIASEAK